MGEVIASLSVCFLGPFFLSTWEAALLHSQGPLKSVNTPSKDMILIMKYYQGRSKKCTFEVVHNAKVGSTTLQNNHQTPHFFGRWRFLCLPRIENEIIFKLRNWHHFGFF